MYIPNNPTQSVEILRFEAALAHPDGNNPAWVYIPGFYADYRYILGTSGVNPLICIGVNTSTAEPEKLDNTLKSVKNIAEGNGYDSFIMLNIYAQRATRPSDLDEELNNTLHRENMGSFHYTLSHICPNQCPAVWAAWGTMIERRAYLLPCLQEMAEIAKEYKAKWLCAGSLTKRGHPHHPLYLRKDEKLKEFDIDDYLEQLKTK